MTGCYTWVTNDRRGGGVDEDARGRNSTLQATVLFFFFSFLLLNFFVALKFLVKSRFHCSRKLINAERSARYNPLYCSPSSAHHATSRLRRGRSTILLHRAKAGHTVLQRERRAAAAHVADLGRDAVARARRRADGGLPLERREFLQTPLAA